MTTSLQQQAETWLQTSLGRSAHFRDGQWEAIEALVARRQRLLVVQRTGWGKSLVYFATTRLLRDQGAGVTILISPLLSLMRNQIASAAQYGLVAETLNSDNQDDHARIERALLDGDIDLLLISPERLANDRFQANVWSRLRQQVGLLVVDEAHCISDWGHDFRPNYRRIMGLLDDIPAGTPVLGTTAPMVEWCMGGSQAGMISVEIMSDQGRYCKRTDVLCGKYPGRCHATPGSRLRPA